ncbi:MAG: hypothetical protein MI924_31210 [Chloroflexales bacterium]|nr:hypothetical protein [Chloroflexales bacterium]
MFAILMEFNNPLITRRRAVVRLLLQHALAFATGAMIYVVVEELIPEAQQGGRTDLATSATVVGFTVMMVLDVALG